MKKSIGFYLTIAACVLAAAGAVLYSRVHATEMLVYMFLACGVAAGVLALVIQTVKGHDGANLLVAAGAVLLALGLGMSIRSVVFDFSSAIAGLDSWDILNEYFAFLGATVVSWVVFLVCAFTGVNKKD